MELQRFNWIFTAECSIPKDVEEMLIDKEKPLYAYKTIRDTAILTNKRLIVRDMPGVTGKRIEIYTLPYSSINMYSTESAGRIDFTSEIELWTRAGHIKINLYKNINIQKIEKVLATYTL